MAVGWIAYTNNLDVLDKTINNSLNVITAWDNEKLVGLIRIVGDNHMTMLYYQPFCHYLYQSLYQMINLTHQKVS